MKLTFIISFTILLISCEENVEIKPQGTVGKISAIETLFDSKEPLSIEDSTLLNELNVCEFMPDKASKVSPCLEI